MGIQDAENNALCRPAGWDAVAPCVVKIRGRQRSIDGGKWFRRGAIRGRRGIRWAQVEAPEQEFGLGGVRIERVPVAITVDRSAPRLATLQ